MRLVHPRPARTLPLPKGRVHPSKSGGLRLTRCGVQVKLHGPAVAVRQATAIVTPEHCIPSL